MNWSAKLLAVLAASSAIIPTANAQAFDSGLKQDAPVVAVFWRMPLGTPAQKAASGPSYGLGLYMPADCDGPRGVLACDAAAPGLRQMELARQPGSGWALSANGIDLVGPEASLSLGEQGSGTATVLWVSLGLVAVVGLAAALSEDDKELMCTGNTVPDLLNGRCVPLEL